MKKCKMRKLNSAPITSIFFKLILVSFYILAFCHFAPTRADSAFNDVQIPPPFNQYLLQNSTFLSEGGAELLEGNDGSLALIGIGKVFPQDSPNEPEARLVRMGEMRARAAIMELIGEVEIQNTRGYAVTVSSRKKTSLSSFFQVTATKVEGKVQQLPVVGTWWSQKKNILFVAVGKVIKGEGDETVIDISNESVNNIALTNLEGDEPFVSLIKVSPLLQNGIGAQGFSLKDGRKVLIAVGSSKIQGQYAKAIRKAQLKAISELSGLKNGLKVTSVEYLVDQEQLRVTSTGEHYAMLSEFLSVQEEQVYGKIKALPVVATWSDKEKEMMFVAIGKEFK